MKIIHALEQASEQMQSADLFFGHGTDNAWDEACVLLSHLLGRESLTQQDALEALTATQLQQFQKLVQRRVEEKIPAPYLTGEAWFAGHRFEVTGAVLVPRSPIAELIRGHFSPWVTGKINRVLDLCAGSGCIGIATALELPNTEVCLSDLSAEALQVAERNLQAYGLESRVEIRQSDLFDNLQGQEFDLILSNPPYVDSDDLQSMPAEFRHEPRMGLAAGEDGLDLVRRMLAQAADYLRPGGLLICEVGNSAETLERVYSRVPFTWIEFASGGDGVFVLDREQLVAFRESFEAAYNALLLKG